MNYDPQKHHRRSIRLKGFDYSQAGWYFVTICAQNREILFGDVIDGKMVLNTLGKIIEYHWKKMSIHFKNVNIDEFQIMPNHFHGIVNIIKSVGAMHSNQNNINNGNNPDMNASPQRPHGTKPGSLGAIMQNFQSITSRKINKIRKTPGARLWQRNYYEHIIRNENELNRIRQYIIENPLKWQDNKFFAGDAFRSK
ncbi:MAG: transposase [Calditrichaceae bacterium]